VLVEKQKRLTKIHTYCKTVCGLDVEKFKNKALETQVTNYYQAKGARLMNAVMSGNITNTFDVYQVKQPTQPAAGPNNVAGSGGNPMVHSPSNTISDSVSSSVVKE